MKSILLTIAALFATVSTFADSTVFDPKKTYKLTANFNLDDGEASEQFKRGAIRGVANTFINYEWRDAEQLKASEYDSHYVQITGAWQQMPSDGPARLAFGYGEGKAIEVPVPFYLKASGQLEALSPAKLLQKKIVIPGKLDNVQVENLEKIHFNYRVYAPQQKPTDQIITFHAGLAPDARIDGPVIHRDYIVLEFANGELWQVLGRTWAGYTTSGALEIKFMPGYKEGEMPHNRLSFHILTIDKKIDRDRQNNYIYQAAAGDGTLRTVVIDRCVLDPCTQTKTPNPRFELIKNGVSLIYVW